MLRRRHFLRLAGTLLQTILILPYRAWPAWASSSDTALADIALEMFANPESAAAVGHRYLQGVPGEGGMATLTARLSDSLARSSIPSKRRPLRHHWIKADLALAIQWDFQHGEVVLVDGWVLAQTEADICALVEVLRQRNELEGAV